MPSTVTLIRRPQQVEQSDGRAPCQNNPEAWDIPPAVRDHTEKVAVQIQVARAVSACNSDDKPCPLRDWCRADTMQNPPAADYDGVRGGWIWYGQRAAKPRIPVPPSTFNPIIRDTSGRAVAA